MECCQKQKDRKKNIERKKEKERKEESGKNLAATKITKVEHNKFAFIEKQPASQSHIYISVCSKKKKGCCRSSQH
jgi:transcription termination factor Rho